jgi:hypothetical protein
MGTPRQVSDPSTKVPPEDIAVLQAAKEHMLKVRNVTAKGRPIHKTHEAAWRIGSTAGTLMGWIDKILKALKAAEPS